MIKKCLQNRWGVSKVTCWSAFLMPFSAINGCRSEGCPSVHIMLCVWGRVEGSGGSGVTELEGEAGGVGLREGRDRLCGMGWMKD
jgi:hypothetical protein